jgi:hypothetical protein
LPEIAIVWPPVAGHCGLDPQSMTPRPESNPVSGDGCYGLRVKPAMTLRVSILSKKCLRPNHFPPLQLYFS